MPWLALACAAGALLLLLHVHLRHVVTASILHDDAYNASVAKNLALGIGYSTSYHYIMLFNPEASAGPAILLPAAALVRAFGNSHWVPNLAIVLATWSTLVAFLFLLHRYLSRGELLRAAALIALALVLLPDEIGLFGEVPGTLLAGSALLLVCRERRTTRAVAGAGILLALAILCKLILALVLPVAVACLVAGPRQNRGSRGRGGPVLLGAFLGGLAVPLLAWQAWQALALDHSIAGFLSLKASQLRFFATYSGLQELNHASSLSASLLAKLVRNARLLPGHFGWPVLALLMLALFAGIGSNLPAVLRERRLVGLRLAAFALIACGLIHFGWWLFSRTGSYRHLLPGTLFFAFGTATATIAAQRTSRLLGGVAVALLLIAWLPLGSRRREFLQLDYRPRPRVAALLATRDEIVKLQQDPRTLLVGWERQVAHDLEYVLPNVGNFRDVTRLQPSAMDGKRILLVRNEFFGSDQSPELALFQAACERKVLYVRAPFVIAECPDLWRLTFPWAETEPRILHAAFPLDAIQLPAGIHATLAHARSALAFQITGDLREITVGFGILDGAWQGGAGGMTDGVEFSISLVDERGTRKLWSRLVDPGTSRSDRGVLAATIPVPDYFRGGQVVAETLPGKNADNSWDWSYWSGITFR